MLKKLVKCLCFMCLVLTVTLCVSCKGKNEKIKVGIIKYTTATPLDAARSGIIEGLKEAGYVDGDNIEIVDSNIKNYVTFQNNQFISLLQKDNDGNVIFNKYNNTY